MELLTIFIVWIFGAVLAGKLADRKGLRGGTYVLISLLLSPLVGLIAAAVAAPNERAVETARVASGTDRKCPFCAEVVKREAIVCRFCHKDLAPPEPLPVAPEWKPRFKNQAEYLEWRKKDLIEKTPR